MISVTIDGRQVEVPEGTLIVEAARRVGVAVPVYCYHPKLKPAGACRICMVSVQGMPRPVTACTTPATAGMVVQTEADPAREARRGVLEFLLINHPLDCPICDKGGECDLQDFTLAHGPGRSRFRETKIHRRKAVSLGPLLVLDEERCILCQRCVRYEDEVLGEHNLVLGERGSEMVIGPEGQDAYAGHFSGNNVELCPVGALTSRTYRFKARPWDIERTPVVCPHCSLGCNMRADARHGTLMRLMSREEPEVDGGWLCDRGRYGLGITRAAERLQHPLVRRSGELVAVSWESALHEAAVGLAAASRPGGLGGARLTDEEADLFQRFIRRVLRSESVDWRVGRQAWASPEAAGLAPAVPADLDQADLILLCDTCPGEEAPVLDLRIRRAVRERGARLIDAGPVAGARVVAAERVARLPEDLPATLSSLAGAVREASHPVVVWNGRGSAAVVEALRALAAPTLLIGEFHNARGAEAAGCLPGAEGADAAAMLSGAVDALYVAGANPVATFPDGAGARRSLEALRFLVVQDLFLTETAALAHVVLPAAGPFEKAGTCTNLAGRRQATGRSVAPPGEALPDGEIIVRLAAAMQIDLARAAEGEGRRGSGPATAPLRAAAAADGAAEPGSGSGAGGLRLLVRPRLFRGSGTTAFDPLLEPVRRSPPEVRLHPSEAAALGLAHGDDVEVCGGDAVVAARLAADPGVVPGLAVVDDRTAGVNRLGDRVAVRALTGVAP